ncbi:ABC transporter permease [Haloferax volcanii]|uniref:ABC transporter permease n=2 Tax=Haloferax volcanii TaxID=2246 RepID=A0A8T5CJN8_HALVO|nr:ABC transporter permease [Haloferax volcanii]ELY32356.1 putative dipeptides/oligopeptides ABC transporter permease [Haloferax volcanii DS2]MBS8118521.1 ABC transporter permease [Haloferax volcanii]MBS8123534.1 ABC transporter permease [Haloferax volcanii]MBS8127402.1 ABC transporter permease [Haloferax volcanii]MBS8131268.1 ABC transporter permease [Haloferax volcanii]
MVDMILVVGEIVSRIRTFLSHGIFAVVAVYAVVTLAFVVIALTPDPGEAALAHSLVRQGRGDQLEAKLRAYRAARNLDVPVTTRYARWLVDITVLDWGRSFATGRSVLSMVREGLAYTLSYVVPGVVVGTAGGIWAGLSTARDSASNAGRGLSVLSYAAFGVPSFWLAAVFFVTVAPKLSWFPDRLPTTGPFSPEVLLFLAPAAVIVAVNVFAGQLRYARTKGSEYFQSDFVRQHRAVGVSRRKVMWYVLRVAAVPLLAVSLADLIAILVVNVFVVEYVFNVPGVGFLTYQAVLDRDMPVVLGMTMVVALAGIGANFLQEVANTLLDPRIGDGGGAP